VVILAVEFKVKNRWFDRKNCGEGKFFSVFEIDSKDDEFNEMGLSYISGRRYTGS
jgi:hypothetical protein